MSKIKKNTTPEAQSTDEIVLSLTQQQTQAALLWEVKSENEIAAALDITPELLTQWKNLPIFLAEIADHRLGVEASPEEKQAAALVFANTSYAQTEAIVGLEEGTLIEWVQEDGFWTENNSFSELLKEMKEGVPNKFNEAPEPEVENRRLSDDQVRAIPLIIEGKTDAQVGETLGKRRETINRWRNQDEHFIKELQVAREAYLDAQITALSATTPKVITVLQDLLDSEDEKNQNASRNPSTQGNSVIRTNEIWTLKREQGDIGDKPMSAPNPDVFIGIPKEDIDTPALLIDVDIMEANIQKMADYFKAVNADLRPHVKTHKTPIIAHKQMEAGAIGMTCAKLGEAEAMIHAGIRDVLIANQIVGKQKIARSNQPCQTLRDYGRRR